VTLDTGGVRVVIRQQMTMEADAIRAAPTPTKDRMQLRLTPLHADPLDLGIENGSRSTMRCEFACARAGREAV
jgi:hypothetical protein